MTNELKLKKDKIFKENIAKEIKKALELGFNFKDLKTQREGNNYQLVTRWKGVYCCYGKPDIANNSMSNRDYNYITNILKLTMLNIEKYGQNAYVDYKIDN